jgi:ADP-heptose:LPS heptosyltransferase/predicted SAM-dependent methyltransferase
MVWRADDPQGNEVRKVRYDLMRYAAGAGLDLGCGGEKVLPHFLGVDSGKDAGLYGATIRADVNVVTCERLPIFADRSFDTVFSSHLLEHIEDTDSALSEWWRLVKDGGHLVLYLPHADLYPNIGQPGANPDHKHDFRNADIVDAMARVASDWELIEDETRDQLREYSFLQVYRKNAALGTPAKALPARAAGKRAAVMRPGAYGDALWGASVAAGLKADGYHVTFYTGPHGEEVVRHDPNIDEIIVLPKGLEWPDEEWLLYYLWEARKYEKWVNLIGVAEGDLLPHPTEVSYYWRHDYRRQMMDRNYLEAIHDAAGLPHNFAQRFYPTEAERAWASEQRRVLFPGPLVVVAPTGSSPTKTWPHTQAFIDGLAKLGVYSVVLGDVRQPLRAPQGYGCVLGRDLSMRLAMTLALEADVVVGTETAILNAVAMESSPSKVVLLSHSSVENLTKHWVNTLSFAPGGLPCYPCHRLHHDFSFCTQDPETKFAACQSAVGADSVLEAIAPLLLKKAAA